MHERLMNMAVPAMIGFIYIAMCLASFQLLGEDVPNPLRSFALSVVAVRNWSTFGNAFLGTLIGSMFAVIVDILVFTHYSCEEPDEVDEEGSDSTENDGCV